MPEKTAKPNSPPATRPRKTRPPAATSAPNAKAARDRAAGQSASRLIDQRIRELPDWRGETLARMRALILEAVPDMTEEWKWMGTPVWSHAGNVCTGETYQHVVKLTFARGASLKDPRKLFNSSLAGNTRRAIDIRVGETIDATAFKALVRAAVAENLRHNASKSPRGQKSPDQKSRLNATKAKLSAVRKNKSDNTLLAGGNPQIAKADGDAPVQAYIAAMPDWKQEIGRRLDALITRNVPKVRKAVKWNSPFYGIDGQGWFLSFHVFTRYVKVTFFHGASLKPIPPGGTERSKDARWIDIHEDDPIDEPQLAKWVKQAATLPGWNP